MGADRRFRSLLEMHRLMQVWGCVGCVGRVGVLLPARTPSDQVMAVRPPPSAGYLMTSLTPLGLSSSWYFVMVMHGVIRYSRLPYYFS